MRCRNVSDIMFNIEEEDLVVNEKETFRNETVTVYEAEYLDLKADFVLFEEQELLEKEIECRIKTGNIFHPSILGLCQHSSLGKGLVMEKVKGESVFTLVYNDELKFPQKVDLIYSLISLVDFSNSRNLFFDSLGIRDLIYDLHSEKLYIVKYPLIGDEREVNSLINQAPEIILSIASRNAEEEIESQNLFSQDNSWNLGLLIFEILERRHLIFSKFESKSSLVEKISKLDNTTITSTLNYLSYNQYIKNILKKLLKLNPKQRTSSKLVKQTFNKSLILENYLEQNYRADKESRREKDMMSLNQSNFYLNESAYPMNNEASLMDITKDLNFNVTINCKNGQSKEEIPEEEEIEVNTKRHKGRDEEDEQTGQTGPSEINNYSSRGDNNVCNPLANHFENKQEISHSNETLIDEIFENLNKKQTYLNLIDDNKEGDIGLPLNKEDNLIIPICGEINKEGENFIQFEEEKKYKENKEDCIVYCVKENERLIDLNQEVSSVAVRENLIVINPTNSSYLSHNSSHSIITEQSIFLSKPEKSSLERLEEIANNYQLTQSDSCLKEIEEILLQQGLNSTLNNTLINTSRLKDSICNNEEQISPTLWDVLICLAFTYLENDDIKSHYTVSSILYSTMDRVYPTDSYKIALAKFHYGKSMKDYSCNYSLALNLFSETLNLLKKCNEENSKLGVQVKFFLGSLYDDMGMLDESIDILKEVLNLQIQMYTEEHTFTARTYNCLGIAEDNRGNYRQAREYYQKAYSIFKHLSYGLETVDCAKVLNNLAGIYYKWEDYLSCIKFYLKVLEVYQRKYGEDNSSYVAITYYNLGNCYFILNNNEKAVDYLKRGLDIFSRELGPSHPQTAMCFKTLGDLYFSLNESRLALDIYSQCVNTFLEKYGDDNDLYISTISKIRKLKAVANL